MFSFGFFRETDAQRLNKLENKNSQPFKDIIQTNHRSLKRKSSEHQNIIKKDIALILANPKKFQNSALVHSARLYPDPLVADARIPSDVVRLIIKETEKSIENSITLEEASPHDMHVMLACLQNLRKEPKTLTMQDVKFMDQRFFEHPAVINDIHRLEPLLDAAEKVKPGTWTDAAGGMFKKKKQKEGYWCLSNALIKGTATEPRQQKLFRYTCEKLIKESEIEALKTLLKTKDFSNEIRNLSKNVLDLSQSSASDTKTYATILTTRHEMGTKLVAEERAWLIKYYAKTAQKTVRNKLIGKFIDEPALNIILEAEGLTAEFLSEHKKALPRHSYLRLILKAYGRAIEHKVNIEARLPYLSLLEKAVGSEDAPEVLDAHNTSLRNIINSLNKHSQEIIMCCDALRSGKHNFLLKLYPDMSLYRSTLLNAARKVIKSGGNYHTESVCEVVLACHKHKNIDSSDDEPLIDKKLVEIAWRNSINTGQIDKLKLLLMSIDLKKYYNSQTVSHKVLTNMVLLILSVAKDDSKTNNVQFIRQRAIHRLLRLYRLSGNSIDNRKITEALAKVTSQLCFLTDYTQPFIKMLYSAWDPMKSLPNVLHHIDSPKNSRSIHNVMRMVGDLNIKNAVRRNEFASALVEKQLFGHGGRHVIETVEAGKTIQCNICWDDIQQGQKVYKLDKECKGIMCGTCIEDTINNLFEKNKCQWDCHCHVNSDTAIALGANIKTVLDIRATTIFRHLNKLDDMFKCESTGCIGAYQETAKECVLCHENQTYKTEIDTVRNLLDYIGEMPSNKHYNGDNMIRECFGCGHPFQKGRACATVTHEDCNTSFDFIGGLMQNETGLPNHRYYDNASIPAQQYIPNRTVSVLWKTGFYSVNKGCKPKTRNPELMKRLIDNKETWFNNYKKNTLNKIEEKKKSKSSNAKSDKKFAPLSNIVNYSENTNELDMNNLLTGDLISYQEGSIWKIGTLHIHPESREHVSVVGEDGKKRPYKWDTPTLQPLGSTPIMQQNFLPGEPIEYCANNLPEAIKNEYFSGNAEGWHLGQVEKSDKDSVWVKLKEGSRAVLLTHNKHVLAPAETHHR